MWFHTSGWHLHRSTDLGIVHLTRLSSDLKVTSFQRSSLDPFRQRSTTTESSSACMNKASGLPTIDWVVCSHAMILRKHCVCMVDTAGWLQAKPIGQQPWERCCAREHLLEINVGLRTYAWALFRLVRVHNNAPAAVTSAHSILHFNEVRASPTAY